MPELLPSSGNLSDRVARYLVEHIRRHRLPSGAVVPSEIRLSQQLDVSRGIVREAYRALGTAGVLDIANGRAPRVGRLNNRAVRQFLQHALATAQASEEQVFDVRGSLEVRAAALAAQRRTDEDAEALRAEVATMRQSARRRERFVKADIKFHEIIAHATGNPLLSLLGDALCDALALTIRAGFDSRHSEAELARVVEIHDGIAEAIARGDADGAARWMTTHFQEARQFVLSESARTEAKPRRAAGI